MLKVKTSFIFSASEATIYKPAAIWVEPIADATELSEPKLDHPKRINTNEATNLKFPDLNADGSNLINLIGKIMAQIKSRKKLTIEVLMCLINIVRKISYL